MKKKRSPVGIRTNGGKDMKTYVAIGNTGARATYMTEENVRLLESLGEVKWASGDRVTPEQAAAEIGDADIYVTLWGSPRLDEQVLKNAPNVKLLVHLAGTVVPFVSDAMFDRGIRVICGNEFFAESVAEGCIAYMLSALRMIPDQATALKNEKRWKGANGQLVEDRGLLNKTVGIVSFGAISKYLVEMLQVFHCKIKLYSRRPLDEEYCRAKNIEQASMEEIFSTCDIISIQTAYNEHTHHMINRDLLKLIKPGALFLNTSRGKVIDELALIEELKDGRFTAFLDVYDQEPPAPENELFNLPNVYMMPHRGGPTIDRRPVIAENLFKEAYAYVNDPTSPLRDEITREKAATMTNR